jgi:hypothetical protein
MQLSLRVVAPLGLVLLAGSAFAWQRSRGAPPAPLGAGTPVVVELFSSEGCASCPPADDYLTRLDTGQPVAGVSVLALELHVEYWDQLGWKDPFGSDAFSARQRAYAQVLDDHRTYTPEIVIDGWDLVRGGDEEQAAASMRASAARPRAKVGVERSGDEVAVRVDDVPPAAGGDVAEVWLAITESGLETEVRAGENRGRTLKHAPVVRALRKLGEVSGAAFSATVPLDAQPGWKPRALRAVVLVQRRASRVIVGAGAA